MRKLTRIIAAAFAAALVLSLAASGASARNRVEVSTTASLLSGRLTFVSGTRNIITDVTLHATMERLIAKILLAHVGDITAVLTANCRTNIGAACEPRPLVPMLIGYGAIRGTLPTITGVLLLILVAFLLLIGGFVRCLFRGLIGALSEENPARTFRPLPEHDTIPLWEDDLTLIDECPREGEFTGSFVARPEISIRLLER